MQTPPFLATIRGIDGNPAVREINVRSGPQTSFTLLFKAQVGQGNLPVLDAKADEKEANFQGKVYQWLLLRFPSGARGWVRDDLLAIQGDGRRLGYPLLAVATFAFSLARSGVVAPPPPPVDTPERVRQAAFAITSAFEGNGYAAFQNQDKGIISYGRFQFTLAAGSLITLINNYVAQSKHPAALGLRPFLPRIQAADPTLRGDTALRQLLIDAATDPIMQRLQDETAHEGFWKPIQELSVIPRGIRIPLGQALIFDIGINHGKFNHLLPKTDQSFGLTRKSNLAQNNIDERTYLQALAQFRKENLYALADKLGLRGLRVRGDFWVERIQAGDWNIQGNAAGIVLVNGKPVQVRSV
jgi:hypothetical protein